MKKLFATSFTTILILFSHAALTDDLDIYITSPVSAKARVLFIIDESGSMAFGPNTDRCLVTNTPKDCFLNDDQPSQRTFQVKKAMRTVIDESDDDLYMAIMGFRGKKVSRSDPLSCQIKDEGGNCLKADIRVLTKFLNLEESNSRGSLKWAVTRLGHDMSTPTSSALHDAVQWYKEGIDATRHNGSQENIPSPILNHCQPNHIVLLSDGAPNSNSIEKNGWGYTNNDLDDREPDNYSPECEWSDKTTGHAFEATETPQDGRCSPDFVEYAHNADLNPSMDGTQFVTTHTIGFHTTPLANTFLAYIAEKGGGDFFTADNADELTEVLQSLVHDAKAVVDTSINTPTIPFDPSNIAVSQNSLYLPVFKPAVNPFWFGNLKKYEFKITTTGDFQLVDANDASALNVDNSFVDDARSFWSDTPDGNNPLAGGSASKRTGSRNLYTYINKNGSTPDTLIDHRLYDFVAREAHPDILNGMLGVTKSSEVTALLKWISTGHGFMGAPLHTAPALLNYQDRLGTSQSILLITTSEGVLSAIDPASGEELWAYMPKELLENIKTIKYQVDNPDDTKLTAERIYGLDGHLEILHDDTNGDNLINGSESVTAIFGMRRGGRNYYALDITNPESPEFKWEIIGGEGNFRQLGQTWAKPDSGKIIISGVEREVILFSGGYDPDQDVVNGARVADDIGNALYIVDAESGERLWWASSKAGASLRLTNMTNSIAADARPVDVDDDGIWDRIYLADTGGRIIRIDFYTDSDDAHQINGYILADLNGGTANSNRRFFTSPEVGYYASGNERFYALLAGSGDRPDPMDHSVQNRFYMIKDYYPWSPQRTGDVYTPPQPIVENTSLCGDINNCHTLYDATTNLTQSGTTEEQQGAHNLLSNTSGWYIDLAEREMSASRALLYNHNLYFTTFSGRITPAAGVCDPSDLTFTSRLFALNLRTAGAVIRHFDNDTSDLSTADRSVELNVAGLPPAPSIFFVGETETEENGETVTTPVNKLFVGAGLDIPVSSTYRPVPLWWEEVINVD
ncbi:hypothetical protein BOW40_01240 [Solemya velum gill symbiont]|uniref:Type IV pilus assembly tip-associated adhesin PilY1-like protein PilY1 n=1 Tax=Solemya velum gill symbiont TaxID=2340 RepID=A0A0B0HCB9_SOVGS|nr:PilC/PilY family type IV pilus protein [Solemya velum gill symbiont]KHF25519.1 type IV pilus assembly tip-associated adhesin PilY1-like protein PilY1 [Solemya velum gill symbiont]OOZ52764.1 hypothetical protein BOW40_01240 [Solemya velum gill symbiont]